MIDHCPHRVQTFRPVRCLWPERLTINEYVCNDCGEIIPRPTWPCLTDGRIEDKEARWI